VAREAKVEHEEDMALTARARRIGSLKNEIDVNGRHTIVTDEPEDLGGTDEAAAPHELLAAALAACVATMIELYAERRSWPLGAVTVDVAYEPEDSPRRVETAIELTGDLSQEQAGRLLRVAQTCPLRRALESEFSFEEQLTVTSLEAVSGGPSPAAWQTRVVPSADSDRSIRPCGQSD
jgi:putative redox protein